MPRPATGETPRRFIRIDDERWGKVQEAAQEDSTTSTEIVKRAIDEHLARRERQKRAKR
jgi:predicted transcriptional regulator